MTLHTAGKWIAVQLNMIGFLSLSPRSPTQCLNQLSYHPHLTLNINVPPLHNIDIHRLECAINEQNIDLIWFHQQLWKFSFARRKWERLQTTGYMPVELASHSGKLLVMLLLILKVLSNLPILCNCTDSKI